MTKLKAGDIDGLSDERKEKQLRAAYQKQGEKFQESADRHKTFERSQQQANSHYQDVPAHLRSRYGVRTDGHCCDQTVALRDISADMLGQNVSFNARLHHSRSMSARMVFIVFRQQVDTLQGVLRSENGDVPENFVRWGEHLDSEVLVHVHGKLGKPPYAVTGCSIHKVEVAIETMHLVVPVDGPLTVDVHGMDKAQEQELEGQQHVTKVGTRHDAAYRIPSLRTPAMQSIFRIRSGICNAFRSVLNERDFIEIQTPKLQAAATESGADVFKLNYFGRTAFLAQSPQLAKQMAISADFGRVYEIGPVFRAEDSNTHRHLTEYTGLDLEMEIGEHYHNVMNVVDELFKRIFKLIYERYPKEIQIVKEKFPHEDLVWLDETLRLSFKEAVDLLNSSGWKDDEGRAASADKDIGTKAEVRIGQLVKEKYKTDYYIIDKFPTSARPFYTKLDADDAAVTNSFDVFLRGQEIATGGQRINDPRELEVRMGELGIDPRDLSEYVQAFSLGAPPHAGCGMGLDRVVFLLLGLPDVRYASLFPRDPKSLPEKTKSSMLRQLPYPGADTLRYNFGPEQDHLPMPPVEHLIANYGDSTNTSWLDDRYTVWRDEKTGGAVGYAETNGYAIVMGDPLCDSRQHPIVISSFLRYLLKQAGLRPIWILASAEIEEILGTNLNWRTFSCVAEARIQIGSDAKPAKKKRQEKHVDVGLHQTELGDEVPRDLRAKCDRRIADWQANREGKQVHITDVRPWLDMQHRQYFWAEDRDGDIAGLVVLAQLSPQHGHQLKFTLDFPGAPGGCIEALISRAIEAVRKDGAAKELTFGAQATPELHLMHNLHGLRAKAMRYVYKAVVNRMKLVQKNDFRGKFGAAEDPLYICYPFMGLGLSGARTLVKFFEDN